MFAKRILAGGIALAGCVACTGCTNLAAMTPDVSQFQFPNMETAANGPDLNSASTPSPSPPPVTPIVTSTDLVPIGGGNYSNPATGTVYVSAGSGTVIDTQTGAVMTITAAAPAAKPNDRRSCRQACSGSRESSARGARGTPQNPPSG